MKIGIISDTHDNLHAIARAVEVFNNEKCELVLHAGDYIAPFTIKPLSNLRSKLIGVFGNNDGDKILLLQRFKEKGFELYPSPYELEFNGKKILLTHFPDMLDIVAKSNE